MIHCLRYSYAAQNNTLTFNKNTIVPQLSKCLKFEAVWGVLTDRMI